MDIQELIEYRKGIITGENYKLKLEHSWEFGIKQEVSNLVENMNIHELYYFMKEISPYIPIHGPFSIFKYRRIILVARAKIVLGLSLFNNDDKISIRFIERAGSYYNTVLSINGTLYDHDMKFSKEHDEIFKRYIYEAIEYYYMRGEDIK